MRLRISSSALVAICLAIGCGRGGDTRSVPPLPPPPGGIDATPDTWEYAKCAKALRSAREQFVLDCSRSRSTQQCRQLAAEQWKDEEAFCESLLMH